MLTAISLLTAGFFVVLGYLKPSTMGWLVLSFSPVVIGFIGLTVVPDTVLPLRTVQVLFAVSLGVLLAKNNLSMIRSFVCCSRPIQFLFLFLFLMLITSLQNVDFVFWKFYLFHYIPKFLSAVIIGFLMVRDDKSFNSLVTIFTCSALVISIFSVVEYYTMFNINNWLYLATSPTVNLDQMQTPRFVVDVLRPVGTEGDPISTGIKLIFFLPFVILNLYRKTNFKKIISGWGPLVLTFVGILLCQSRAVYISLFVGILLSIVLSKKIAKQTFFLVFAFSLLIVVLPPLNEVATRAFEQRFVIETVEPICEGRDIDIRVKSLATSIDLFWGSPIYGHGSYLYSYEVLLDYMDAPPIILYAVSGGLLLVLPFIFFILDVPSSIIGKVKYVRGAYERLIVIFTFLAIVMGIIPLLFNNTDNILYLVVLTYASFYRVFIYNRRGCSDLSCHRQAPC